MSVLNLYVAERQVVDQSLWSPVATPSLLLARARLYREIRLFFQQRDVLEVETPLLSQGTITDPMIAVFETEHGLGQGHASVPLYLQTSPEFAMKRLIASGIGSIFQIAKAFRKGESGRHHNPEFTLLEWYRVGFDLELLQIEVEALLRHLALSFGREISVSKATYSDLFIDFLGLHPLDASLEEMARLAEARGLPDAKTLCGEERIHWLDFLFSCLIQPQLTPDCLVMVSRYPAILPSLARASLDDPRWVERVELFWGGMELGNGFHELTDPSEQEFRFKQDLAIRNHLGLDLPSMDERLLDALRYGMDNCAGIAIGLDRLLMVLMGVESIGEVLAFPFERA